MNKKKARPPTKRSITHFVGNYKYKRRKKCEKVGHTETVDEYLKRGGKITVLPFSYPILVLE